ILRHPRSSTPFPYTTLFRSKHAWFLLPVLLAACVSTTAKSTSTSPYAPAPDPNAPPPKEVPVVRKPWTERFMTPGTLVAEDVRRSEEHTSELQSLRHLVCRL